MKVRTTPTLFTATIAMFFTVSLTANPAKAQEKPATNNLGSSEQLLSTNANSLSSGKTVNLTQESTTRGRRGLSQGELDEVTNNINLQMQKNRDPRWKREKVWFEEKWDSFSTDF
ncbi:MAG: hypothetical protein F6K22_09490 [Okeania sp. SIO2F4]|uniref:hypothetical protein n=1 Tax=Microcoleaceae TaxID=1892252 RepID=UPI00142CD1AE|nr:hypothetical protein [Okeania sp. SIO2F4]MDJ0520148.1 hypothetical protein [Trichodesmium sp. MO_231.B1]NES03065.1 hypothetical protein [Okeania sp. SIO2F4]